MTGHNKGHGVGPLWVLLAALSALGCDDSVVDRPDGARMDAGRDLPLCERHPDCDDGLYCTGRERCVPGDPEADARGCVVLPTPCEVCDEEMDRCIECRVSDVDGDGEASYECGGTDCDDHNAQRFSRAPEICDPLGVDEDCNPTTIHAQDGSDGDQDGDGFISARCSNPTGDGGLNRGLDCDDRSAGIAPDATENCNGVDDDCDGLVDEGRLTAYYLDRDGDGAGDRTAETFSCAIPAHHVTNGDDCDDSDPNVFPAATEVCNGVDDNCDGVTDPGCSCSDGDTLACGSDVGDCTRGVQTCTGGVFSEECLGGRMPIPELCGGGDEDCDGMVDERVAVGQGFFYVDADGDGYGLEGSTAVNRCPAPDGSAPEGFSVNAGDCVDSGRALSADIHPDAPASPVPHCDGAAACMTPGGEFGCTVCVGGGACFCSPGVASFDFDCDEQETPQARHSCGCSAPPTCTCGGGSGPTATHTDPALCGTPVEYASCCTSTFPGSCTAICSRPMRPLACH